MTTDRPQILITGGLGYVGGRLAKYLAETGHYEVIATTRRAPSQFPDIRIPNLSARHLDLGAPIDHIRSNLQGVHTIVHLAAANEIVSGRNPLLAIEINTRDAMKLLMGAEEEGIKRFIYFSTMHVYGSPLCGDIQETDVCRPVHPYAITHKSTEDFVLAARDKQRIEGIVFRLSNSFGPPLIPSVDRWTLLVNDLCKMATEEQRLTLRSDGSQLRDFVTLTDVCRATHHMIELSDTQDGLFNLGGDYTASVLQIAELIQHRVETATGLKLPLSRKAADPLRSPIHELAYHIDKLESTGFQLNKNIQLELDEMIQFCLTHFSVS